MRPTIKQQRASAFRLSSVVMTLLLALLFSLALAPVFVKAQDRAGIVGDWEGTLDPGAQPKKRIVVHISAAQDDSLSGTIDYPDQETSGIQITAITYKARALHFESSSIPALYDGTMDDDHTQITGTWKQGAAPLSLILKRTP
ncbi:MAG TPA: hypothetical protein VKR59_16120 [Terriglobales bacterium]|nr:hypothetical protein [Terriglobales bacterium]